MVPDGTFLSGRFYIFIVFYVIFRWLYTKLVVGLLIYKPIDSHSFLWNKSPNGFADFCPENSRISFKEFFSRHLKELNKTTYDSTLGSSQKRRSQKTDNSMINDLRELASYTANPMWFFSADNKVKAKCISKGTLRA